MVHSGPWVHEHDVHDASGEQLEMQRLCAPVVAPPVVQLLVVE